MLPVWTPFWSIGYHDALLRLVDAEFTAMGLWHAFGVTGSVSVTIADRDTVLDLRALAQRVASRPLRDWPELVREEVSRHVTAERAAVRFCQRVPSLDHARPLLALRLVGDTTPAAGRRGLAPDLAAELVYELPAGPTPVPEAHLTAWGAQVDAAFSAAEHNTRVQVRGALARAREIRNHYDVVIDASPYTASTVLCMDELAGPVTPYGVLFGVPSRHELVAHVVTNPDSAAVVLRDLPAGLRHRHARAAAPLSPRLYRWHAGQVHVLPPDTDAADLAGELAHSAG